MGRARFLIYPWFIYLFFCHVGQLNQTSLGQNSNDATLICCLLTAPEFSQCFGRIFAFFRITSLKKEIVTLLLNRNTEAERFLGGCTGIVKHF